MFYRADPPRYNFIDTFEVLVGDEEIQQRFTVHKDVACKHSPFFRAARSQRWNHESSRPTELLDTKPAVFEEYLRCIYADRVETASPGKSDILGRVQLWILADRLQDLTTANLVADEIVRDSVGQSDTAWRFVPTLKVVAFAYSHTAPGSAMRRLMRDLRVYDGAGSKSDETSLEYEGMAEALFDIYQEMGRLIMSNARGTIEGVFLNGASTKPKCHYHQHDEEHPKCKGD